MMELEKRLDDIEQRQADLDSDLDYAREKIEQLKRRQGRTGSLAPLAKALRYHHQMNNRWTYLASEGHNLELTAENYLRLSTEFARMREVVTHYEYVAQCLLGIDPSPSADLGENDEEEYRDELTGVRMIVERDMLEEHPKITVICPEQHILSIEQVNAAIGRLRRKAKIDPTAFPDVLASERKEEET